MFLKQIVNLGKMTYIVKNNLRINLTIVSSVKNETTKYKRVQF